MKKSGKKITLESVAESVEELAIMVAEGFSGMATKADIARLEQGQEDIKLRLDRAAYRFELVELQNRVTKLEQKAGMVK